MDLTPNESTEISFQQKCHTEVQWKEKSYHPGQWFSNHITQKCFKGPANILLNLLITFKAAIKNDI